MTEAELSPEFESRMDRILRDGMRSTHNSAIDAAVKMYLLVKDESTAEIIKSIEALKLKEDDGEHYSSSLPQASDAS